MIIELGIIGFVGWILYMFFYTPPSLWQFKRVAYAVRRGDRRRDRRGRGYTELNRALKDYVPEPDGIEARGMKVRLALAVRGVSESGSVELSREWGTPGDTTKSWYASARASLPIDQARRIRAGHWMSISGEIATAKFESGHLQAVLMRGALGGLPCGTVWVEVTDLH